MKPFHELNIPDHLVNGMTPMETFEPLATLYAALVSAYKEMESDQQAKGKDRY